MDKNVVFIFLSLIFLASNVYALGITPALKNIDFVPGKEIKINFQVLDSSEERLYDLKLGGGDLSAYSSLSADYVKGNSMFTLTIKFPENIDLPGQHEITVSVKERPSEESFINTVVEVGAVMRVFVPYPGYYGDLALNIPDGNVDDKLPVELYLINRGDNPLDLNSVYVDFISSTGESVKRIDFTPVSIPVSGERYFRKYLDTKDISPGDYIATGRVLYNDEIKEVNKSFRVGYLFVNITNYTDNLIGNGIQKFYVTLKSKWNSPINGVFIDVNLSNKDYSNLFRTPSVDLIPWEEKTVISYVDVNGLEGNYNLLLNVSYNGKSNSINGNLLIKKDYSLIIYSISAVLAIIFFILVYLVLRRFVIKRKKK